jgi:hypothetical protein
MGPAATPAPFASDDRSLAREFPGDPSVGCALCRLRRAWQLPSAGRRLRRWAAVSRGALPALLRLGPRRPPPGDRRRWMVAAVAPALDEGHGDRQHAEQHQDPHGRMGHAVDGTGLAVHAGTRGAPAIPQEPGTRVVADHAGAQGPDAEAHVVPDGADSDGTVEQPSAHPLVNSVVTTARRSRPTGSGRSSGVVVRMPGWSRPTSKVAGLFPSTSPCRCPSNTAWSQ